MRLVALAILTLAACGSTDPSDLADVEPGLYVLARFDGKPAPAAYGIIEYPSATYAQVLTFDSLWIEDGLTFRRHYRDEFLRISRATPPDTQSTSSQEFSYAGNVLRREGGIVLTSTVTAFQFMAPTTFEVRGDRLIQRMPLGTGTCESDAGGPCTVTRQVILGAEYERR